jgi:xylose isomerase
MDEMLDLAKEVRGLDGLELVGNWHVNDANIHDVARKFQNRGLKIPMLVPDLWTQAKWGRGSIAAPEAATRQAAVDEIRKVMDWAADLDCPYVDVWPGQDGFDYPFQADYVEAWKWMRDALAKCAGHNPKVRMLVEYKPREPRTHCFVAHAHGVLLLLQGLDSVGVLLDVGHSLQGGENVAEAAAILAHHGKLDYLHLNDNYRWWDDDMMVGALHTVEFLELAYWLKRVNYKGWLTLDVFPYRELDKAAVARECGRWIEGFLRAVDRVGMDTITGVIQRADATEITAMVRKAINI